MTKGKWVSVILAVVLVVSMLVVGCAKPAPPPAPAPPAPAPAPPKPAPPKPAPPEEIDPAKVLGSAVYVTAYDVGSTGYGQTAAIGSAIMEKYGIKLRVIPSGTTVGRLAPIKTGMATYTFTADGAVYASRGMFEFSDMSWGPQTLRTVLAHPTYGNVALRGDISEKEIVTPYDLKGKRLTWVPGASTLNIMMDACLAFANLTWDDVERVEFASYGASLKGLIEDKVDAAKASPTASTLYELESAPCGIKHLNVPPDDKEGWARFNEIVPWYSPGVCTAGAGITEANPQDLWAYRYPQCLTDVSTPDDEVYAFVKAIDETLDAYIDFSPEMPRWAIDKSGKPPAGCPWHPGAIKYLKEQGVWTAEDDVWNNDLLATLQKYQDAWKTVVVEAMEQGMKQKEFTSYWDKRRVELCGWR